MIRAPEARKRPLTGPDAVTLARIPLALALATVSLVDPPPRAALVALLAAIAASDLIDGAWARSRGTASRRGAALDSAADAVAATCIVVAVVAAVDLAAPPAWWYAVAAITLGRLAVAGAVWVRTGRPAITHTWANKATGTLAAIAAGVALAAGTWHTWVTLAALAVAGCSVIDEAVFVARSRVYDADGRGCWDARPSGGKRG